MIKPDGDKKSIAEDDMDEIMNNILELVNKISDKFPPYNSVHEGYAVMLEEFDELWDEVKRKDKNYTAMYNEAMQVACTAIRFMQLVKKRKRDNNIR